MMEYRAFDIGAVALDEQGVLTGLAAPFNKPTMIGQKPWGFREQIAPGAFTKTIQESDVVMLYNHDSSKPLARKSAGSLSLSESDRGLEIEAKPVDTTYGQDLRTCVKARVIKGMSFGFEVVKDDWTDDDGKPSDKYNGTNRCIREVKLHEVSPVTFPAYDDTDIAARSAEKVWGSIRSKKAMIKRTKEALKIETRAAKKDKKPVPDPDESGRPPVQDRGGDAPGDGSKPYGNVTYADPGYQSDKQKRYPVDTKKHVKAAWAYINKAKNAAAYTAAQLSKIKGAIKAAAKKFGITISEENEAQLVTEWRSFAKRYDPITGERRAFTEKVKPVCSKCGAGLTCPKCAKGSADKKSASDPDETRDKSPVMKPGTQKRIPQIAATLAQAMTLFDKAGIDSLPQAVQEAIALVSSAATHAAHIQAHQGLAPADSAREAEPSTDTPEAKQDETLRILADIADARSREVELGL